MITRLISQFKDSPIHITVLEMVKHFLGHKLRPTWPSKKEEQVMACKERSLSPSILEGNRPLSMKIGSSSYSIKKGRTTTSKVRHSLLKKTDSFILQIT